MTESTPRTRRRFTEPADDEIAAEPPVVSRRRRRESIAEPAPAADPDLSGLDEFRDPEPKPTRTSRSARTEDDEADDESTARRARRRPERTDEEESGTEVTGYSESLISRGWAEAQKNRPAAQGDWTNDFRWNEDPQLIKFLADEPFDYLQHWLNNREGKRGFTCLSRSGPCPLCKAGVKVTQKFVWPILNLTKMSQTRDDGTVDLDVDHPVVENLNIGVTLAGEFRQMAVDPKTGPLSKPWWSLSATASSVSSRRNSKSYAKQAVKDRDLEDDWGINLDDALDAVDAAVVPTPKEAITWSTRSELSQIARELMES